jgi:tetratricopeptide (TPR) repeat protein
VSELYDVVFYGTNQEGEELERTKERVAKLLHLDREKLESLFGRQGGVVLRSSVTQDVAQKYQMALKQAGVRCNSRPAKAKVNKLELAPIDEAGSDQRKFICPACGNQRSLEAGEGSPDQCEQCGVVPAKYAKVSDEKMERARIRRSLLDRHKTTIEEELKLKEEQAAKLRRQRLEEEIRKQLGLPRFLTVRGKLAGSAVVILTAGFGVGVASAILYKDMSFPRLASSSSDQTLLSSSSSEFGHTIQSLDPTGGGSIEIPALKMVAQVAALSKELQDVGSRLDPALSSEGGKASRSQSQSLVLNMLGEMHHDREWDQFLAKIVRDLVASRQYTDAYRVSSQIQDNVQRIDLSGEVAHAFASADTTAALIADLKMEAQGLPDLTDRVFALCRLAAHQAKTGNEAEAQQTAQDALAIADKIHVADTKAVAMSRIAATWTVLGAMRQSQEYFEQVNTLLASTTATVDRVSAYAAVARAYADAGNKSGASRVLQETRQAAQRINDDGQRFRLLAEIAVYQAQLGDTEGAVATAGSIEPVSSRDAALFKTAADQLYSGHIYRAMAIAEPIDTPTHEARAYALLARYQRDTELDALAQKNFDRAIASSNLIVNDVDKAGILSEVARLRMRTGDVGMAGKLFDQALLLVENAGNAHTHDIASALIAKNQARALQTVQAKKTLVTIADASIAEDVRDDIAQMDGTIEIVRSLMPSKTASSN